MSNECIECVDIFIDEFKDGRKFIVFKFENDFEYDPNLDQTEQKWWLDHMRGKLWFTRDIEDKALKVLGKSLNDWPETRERSHGFMAKQP